MSRKPLPIGSTVQATDGSSYTYIIDRVIGDGASSIVYEAHYVDNSIYKHCVRLKECYPYQSSIERIGNDLVWSIESERTNDITAFKEGYNSLMKSQKSNYIVHAFDQFESNNTMYIVMDANDGLTFDQTSFESLKEILSTVKLLAYVVGEYHKKGYLHLDIKPSNFLVYPRPSEHIVLFDVDSITSIKDIDDKKVTCVPYSKGWAAPEQMQGKMDKLCPATDIYSIGAILFQKVMGRAVENEDIGIFADWYFDNEILENINPAIKRYLREIFKKTLSANIKRRYQTVNELIKALDESIKIVNQEQYIESDLPILDVEFVGRRKELADIDTKFKNGARAVFLHAFGGVGKTTLAKKYAELQENEYDAIVFKEYGKNLAQLIDDIAIYNESIDQNQDHKKALKSLSSRSKVLLIIDNFDVEDDDDLDYILSLNCDIIFTTRNDYSQYYSSEKISILELDYLAVEDLVQVFKNEYNKPISEEEEEIIGDVIERFGYVTKLVPIIAKQIIASHISIEEFSNRITDDVFAAFDEENEDIRITSNGKTIRTNSLVYIRAMFNISGLSDEHKTVLRYLYMLKYHQSLTFAEYKRITGEKSIDVLNDLIFLNWVSVEKYEDEDEDENIVEIEEIRVHQLVYDLIAKDFMPNYENVPGIVSYIETQFALVDDFTNQYLSSEGELLPNFEEIYTFVYALQLYKDLVENDENWTFKSTILFLFLFVFFEFRAQLRGFLFDNPKETDQELTVEQVFDLISGFSIFSFSFKEIDQVLCNKDSKQKDRDLMKSYVDEKVKYNRLVLRGYLLKMYFSPYSESCEDTLYELKRLEELCGLEGIEKRINDYISVCDAPMFDENGEMLCDLLSGYNNVISINTKYGYQFNSSVLGLIQKHLQSSLITDDRDYYLKELEKLIIVANEYNSLFSFYGLSEESLLEYNPEQVVVESHWSRKAKRWYDSFISTAANASDVFSVYKMLLTWEYIDAKPKSIVRRILNSNFVSLIDSDNRLTVTEKDQLMLHHSIKQLSTHIHAVPKYKSKPGKTNRYSGLIELYISLIMCRTEAFTALIESAPSKEKNEFLEIIAISKRIVNIELPDIYKIIDKDIENITFDTFDDVINSIDIVRRCRNAQKAKKLKNKILDEYSKLNSASSKDEASRYNTYKVYHLARMCEREDIMGLIEEHDESISERFYLDLLAYDFVLPTDKELIATNFLNEYITNIALFACSEFHNEVVAPSEEYLKGLADALTKNIIGIFTSISDENSWYFNMFEREDPSRSVMGVIPYWLGQFYEPEDKHVALGICYMITKQYDTSMESYPMETMIEYIASNDHFVLSLNEFLQLKNNLKTISEKCANDFIESFGRLQEISIEQDGKILEFDLLANPELHNQISEYLKSKNND